MKSSRLKAAFWMVILVAPARVFPADTEADVAALEQQCQAAREVKLKPVRDAEILRCKENGQDPGYCERYWRDYGNHPVKTPSGFRAPLFYDLPECVRAFEARKKLNLEGK